VSSDPTQPPVPPPPPDATAAPYWITIDDGRIVAIEEQFLP
jgi:hypothetical protein